MAASRTKERRVQEVIGFDEQPDTGSCGKSSLQHALLLLGLPITMRDANRLTRVPRWKHVIRGTNEREIQAAIRRCGLRPLERSFKTDAPLRRSVDQMIDRGLPVIVCVEDFDHWAVLAGRTGERYWWIDSADRALIGSWRWADIAGWIHQKHPRPEFYAIGVAPRRRRDVTHSLVPRFRDVAKMLRADQGLRQYWGYYLEDLLDVFDCPPSPRALPAQRFFDRHARRLYHASATYYADADTVKLRWEIANYRKVAIAHRLTMSRRAEVEAVARLSAALALIACGVE